MSVPSVVPASSKNTTNSGSTVLPRVPPAPAAATSGGGCSPSSSTAERAKCVVGKAVHFLTETIPSLVNSMSAKDFVAAPASSDTSGSNSTGSRLQQQQQQPEEIGARGAALARTSSLPNSSFPQNSAPNGRNLPVPGEGTRYEYFETKAERVTRGIVTGAKNLAQRAANSFTSSPRGGDNTGNPSKKRSGPFSFLAMFASDESADDDENSMDNNNNNNESLASAPVGAAASSASRAAVGGSHCRCSPPPSSSSTAATFPSVAGPMTDAQFEKAREKAQQSEEYERLCMANESIFALQQLSELYYREACVMMMVSASTTAVAGSSGGVAGAHSLGSTTDLNAVDMLMLDNTPMTNGSSNLPSNMNTANIIGTSAALLPQLLLGGGVTPGSLSNAVSHNNSFSFGPSPYAAAVTTGRNVSGSATTSAPASGMGATGNNNNNNNNNNNTSVVEVTQTTSSTATPTAATTNFGSGVTASLTIPPLLTSNIGVVGSLPVTDHEGNIMDLATIHVSPDIWDPSKRMPASIGIDLTAHLYRRFKAIAQRDFRKLFPRGVSHLQDDGPRIVSQRTYAYTVIDMVMVDDEIDSLYLPLLNGGTRMTAQNCNEERLPLFFSTLAFKATKKYFATDSEKLADLKRRISRMGETELDKDDDNVREDDDISGSISSLRQIMRLNFYKKQFENYRDDLFQFCQQLEVSLAVNSKMAEEMAATNPIVHHHLRTPHGTRKNEQLSRHEDVAAQPLSPTRRVVSGATGHHNIVNNVNIKSGMTSIGARGRPIVPISAFDAATADEESAAAAAAAAAKKKKKEDDDEEEEEDANKKFLESSSSGTTTNSSFATATDNNSFGRSDTITEMALHGAVDEPLSRTGSVVQSNLIDSAGVSQSSSSSASAAAAKKKKDQQEPIMLLVTREKIGSGATADVYSAMCTNTGRMLALKVMHIRAVANNNADQQEEEEERHRRHHHHHHHHHHRHQEQRSSDNNNDGAVDAAAPIPVPTPVKPPSLTEQFSELNKSFVSDYEEEDENKNNNNNNNDQSASSCSSRSSSVTTGDEVQLAGQDDGTPSPAPGSEGKQSAPPSYLRPLISNEFAVCSDPNDPRCASSPSSSSLTTEKQKSLQKQQQQQQQQQQQRVSPSAAVVAASSSSPSTPPDEAGEIVLDAETNDGGVAGANNHHRDKVTEEEQRIVDEISLLRTMPHHEHLIRYYGCRWDTATGTVSIAMELARASLRQIIDRTPVMLPLRLVAVYARGILRGLAHLHSQNYIHRDIKCGNILVNDAGTIKLSDFGLSVSVDVNIQDQNNNGSDKKRRRQLCGTPCFLSLELMQGASASEASDIYAFGCTMIELVAHNPWWNYESNSVWEIYARMRRGERPQLPDRPEITPEFRDFVDRCLDFNPLARPSAQQLLQHPFVSVLGII